MSTILDSVDGTIPSNDPDCGSNRLEITIAPGGLTMEQLKSIHDALNKIHVDWNIDLIDRSSEIVILKSNDATPIYGVNTGFGKLSDIKIPAKQTEALQRNLILSHCCGVGEAAPAEITRLVLVLKIAALCRGASGVRRSVISTLIQIYNSGILPIIPCQGSVGASGDLAPLAHLAAVAIGEGYATYCGQRYRAREALAIAGIEPVILGPKEGLALINGTQFCTACALAALFRVQGLARSALVVGALSTDALFGSPIPFRPEIQLLRGHPGQIEAARTLATLLRGSEISEARLERIDKVQDPYCIRCQPQVIGACLDTMRNIERTLILESNAITDNPIVITETDEILSGGNFHAEHVAFAADHLAIIIAEIGSITQRRIATLVDPALNNGLPAFLSPNPGINSGFMIAEVTAAALMAENKHLAAPCSVDSTPTSANQEDHVSMAAHAAWRLFRMSKNLATILGIELLMGAQGVEMRHPLKTSKSLSDVIEMLRYVVPHLDDDRILSDDIAKSAELVSDGTVLMQADYK